MPVAFNVSKWNVSDIELMNATDLFNATDFTVEYSQSIETAPVYLFCCALSLAATSSFLRAGFVLKFIAMIACIVVQCTVLALSQLYIVYDSHLDSLWFVPIKSKLPFYIKHLIRQIKTLLTIHCAVFIHTPALLMLPFTQHHLWIGHTRYLLSTADCRCAAYFGSTR